MRKNTVFITIIKTLVAGVFALSVCMVQSCNNINSTQNITINGNVTNSAGTAIPGAAVRLENEGLQTTTRSDGSFILSGTIGHNLQINALLCQERSKFPIDDVIAVTKEGYLNYRVLVTNSDTSGIEIMLIVCEGTVTDTDGNVYQAVRIGNQVWMAENLRTTKYNDGTSIPRIADNNAWGNDTNGAFCYHNNTTNADAIKKYGALYNWHAVNTKKLSPIGWHVPTDAEWDTLQNYLIVNGYNWDGTTTGNKIAKSLAAKADWWSSGTVGNIGNDLRANNRSGFSALPGGFRGIDGLFCEIGIIGDYWSANKFAALLANYRDLDFGFDNLYSNSEYMSRGLSVRLLRDN